MLTAGVVVFDFEGFRSKKSGFIAKELAITCNIYMDTISFSPPHSLNSLTLSKQKSYQWVSKYMHGLDWERGDYPFCYLQQILQSVVFRFPLSDFYAMGVEKTDKCKNCLREKFQTLRVCYALKLINWIAIGRHHFVTCIQQLAQKDRKTIILRGRRPNCSITG